MSILRKKAIRYERTDLMADPHHRKASLLIIINLKKLNCTIFDFPIQSEKKNKKPYYGCFF